MTGGVCLATRVRYRQSCGFDTWSALLAYLFVSRICVAGLCFCFFALVLFFPLPSDQIGGGFLVCYFFPLFLFFCLCLGCSDGMEREACVCDHGFERSDLCAEIIIIIIIMISLELFYYVLKMFIMYTAINSSGSKHSSPRESDFSPSRRSV